MERLLDCLESGATVVTATHRLARHLAEGFGARLRKAGRTVWETPDVLPWPAWLARCWAEYLDMTEGSPPGRLLSEVQELALWEAVIQDATGETPLLQVSATARSARDAWGLLQAWQIHYGNWQEPLGEDAGAFREWAQRFEHESRDAGWLDRAALPDVLGRAWNEGRFPAPRHVVFAGFDELTPQQETVRRILMDAGARVDLWMPAAGEPAARRVAFPDAEAELTAAARWARELLEAGEAGAVGVVVPDLDKRLAQVSRVFEDVLSPARVLPGAAEEGGAFHISLGAPLDREPVVRTALQALALARAPLELTEVSALLRSPYLADGLSEGGRRALLDARLRGRGEPWVTLGDLRREAAGADEDGPRSWSCPRLAARLARLVDALPRRGARLAASEWARRFAEWLGILGWPGERTLDSREYQAVEAWREVLGDFAALDAVIDTLTLEQALARLGRQAAERAFQPGAPPAPVQVMGLLEASGLAFDHLWIVGMDDGHWPKPPEPHPFIPVEVQRRHRMPRADARRELDYARRVTARLLAAAPTVVVSHPLQEEARPLRASPLVAGLPEAAVEDLVHGRVVPYPLMLAESRPVLETRVDDHGPPLESGWTAGGASVFQDQAACPFRAFARHRLAAHPVEHPGPGLDGAARGNVVHEALKCLWSELGDHAALSAADETAREALVERCVEAALHKAARRHPHTCTPRFLELERTRLVRLLLAWLAVEAGRPPFEAVTLEEALSARVGPLTVRLRPDRVDRLQDGTLAVIDYKSGDVSVNAWLDERPDDPQLPLYCLVEGARVSALAFARLRADGVGFTGLGNGVEMAEGVKPVEAVGRARERGDWAALVAWWRGVLEGLARDFAAGVAVVDPKNPPDTCRYCEAAPLCRIAEQGAGAGEENDDGS